MPAPARSRVSLLHFPPPYRHIKLVINIPVNQPIGNATSFLSQTSKKQIVAIDPVFSSSFTAAINDILTYGKADLTSCPILLKNLQTLSQRLPVFTRYWRAVWSSYKAEYIADLIAKKLDLPGIGGDVQANEDDGDN